VAKNMHLFPLGGAVIGLIIGALSLLIFPYLHPLMAGVVLAAFFVIITGVHHTDALADFADGLVANGNIANKQKAMRDPAVGSAGVVAIVLYIAAMIIVISEFESGFKIFSAIVTAEVISKYVLVLQAYSGRSAWPGFSSPFTEHMKDRKKLLVATFITIGIVLVTSSIIIIIMIMITFDKNNNSDGYFFLYRAFAALGISLFAGAVIQQIANKSFGGVTGDVMGASNEITRLLSLMALVS
jgi:adenosylcobinamide-GDP ribazoletransferase